MNLLSKRLDLVALLFFPFLRSLHNCPKVLLNRHIDPQRCHVAGSDLERLRLLLSCRIGLGFFKGKS